MRGGVDLVRANRAVVAKRRRRPYPSAAMVGGVEAVEAVRRVVICPRGPWPQEGVKTLVNYHCPCPPVAVQRLVIHHCPFLLSQAVKKEAAKKAAQVWKVRRFHHPCPRVVTVEEMMARHIPPPAKSEQNPSKRCLGYMAE